MDLPLEKLKQINFRIKKTPLSADLRPVYKISQVVLILHLSSNKSSASLLKLQLFNWALKNPRRYSVLLNLKENNILPVIRFDPSLNRALNLAVAEGLIGLNNKNARFVLTEKGENFAELILSTQEILNREIEVLKKIKKSISDAYLERLYKERFVI